MFCENSKLDLTFGPSGPDGPGGQDGSLAHRLELEQKIAKVPRPVGANLTCFAYFPHPAYRVCLVHLKIADLHPN